ncbi:beta-lactamase class D [Chitinophaga skermanii]|uniref:beta-lactamase n=1 Tax=Chitinophaga skermanii TaxID=331697 RepID=A0A327QIM8_9BACT|nr:class D beta-lactamase [Chitinophaga skermanii]RAJ03835.1 beta-lactamase class D [Chitinophaga skermanii]
MKRFGWIFLLAGLVMSACSPNNVKNEPSWEKYFAEAKAEGCFMLFDNAQGSFKVYNIERAKERFLPASTFKIFNSLVGMQTGAITDTGMVIKWDGVTHTNPEWNQDLSMRQAFRVSAVPYFQEVARRIGKDTMQFWIDSVGYGNKKISKVDSFWLDNSLQISPDEQLGFMKKLYFDQLPFHKTSMQYVRDVMLMESNHKYKLSYKTGWGIVGKRNIGWMVGWIEENNRPTFFVLNLESEDPNFDMINIRQKITRDILKQEGYFEGKM